MLSKIEQLARRSRLGLARSYRWLLRGVVFVFGWLADLLGVLAPCRFSLLVLLIGGGAFWKLDQGQDVLRAFAEWNGDDARVWVSLVILVSAIGLWAFSTWYWARVILYLRFPGMPRDTPRAATLRVVVPRTLGAAAFLSLALAFRRAALSYADGAGSGPDAGLKEPVSRLNHLAALCVVLALAFLAFVHYRRALVRQLRRWLGRGAGARSRLAALPPPVDERAQFSSVGELPAITRWMVKSFIVLALVLGVIFTWRPLGAGRFLGTVPVLLLAAATWVLFGTLLVYVARRYRVPAFTLLLSFAVVFSFWNDNHAVRVAPGSLVRSDLPSVEEHFKQWYRQRGKGPIFLVAAEGGGIRAAYWTAQALAKVQDSDPSFARHVYVVSSVSGGSLGAAVFAALDREALESATQAARVQGNFGKWAEEILKNDFLSPTLAKLVGPDLLQRFLPFAVNFRGASVTDRGAALEDGWGEAWEKVCREHGLTNCTRFSDSFLSLWAGDKGWLPSLILNATHVESGRRMITTNLPFQVENGQSIDLAGKVTPAVLREPGGEAVEFRDAFDLLATLGSDLPLKSAVHNSARFSYISPAGALIPSGEATVVGHVVDGGYFENSGAGSLLQVLRSVQRACLSFKPACTENVYVLYLRNTPVDSALKLDAAAPQWSGGPAPAANEALSPPRALLNSRSARVSLAVASLVQETAAQTGHFFTLAPCTRLLPKPGENLGPRAPIPLGWSLSTQARKTMDRELDEGCDGADNRAQLQEILSILRPPAERRLDAGAVSKMAEALITAPGVF